MSFPRTLLTLAFGLFAGGIAGAYATTAIYGKRQPLSAAKAGSECAPCPTCAVCPPPIDCAVPPPVLAPGQSPAGLFDSTDPGGSPKPAEPPKPGLPASAMKQATAAVLKEVEGCLSAARTAGSRGMLLLSLTVTASGGFAHISSADVAQRTGELGDVDPCLVEATGRVQFDWPDGEGEGKLRIPIRIE